MLDIAVDPKSLLPVAIETLLYGTEGFDFDMFLWTDSRMPPVLYREKSTPVSPSELQSLLRNEIRTLYIQSQHIQHYEQHLRENVLTDETIAPEVRFSALREANRSVFMASLNAVEISEVTKVAQDIGDDLAALFSNQDNSVESLLGILRHDYYTYTHVTNVSAYCLALAQALGIKDRESLAQIATGALLHDVGKRKIPSAILNKNGKLNDDELALIKSHPTVGFQELCHRDDLTADQLLMVYQHHERLDGRGYPVGVTADEIRPWSRICTIADVYDALTSYRPYRRPMGPQELADFIERNSGTVFDTEMIRCWSTQVMPRSMRVS